MVGNVKVVVNKGGCHGAWREKKCIVNSIDRMGMVGVRFGECWAHNLFQNESVFVRSEQS